jgi:hypothetical protein
MVQAVPSVSLDRHFALVRNDRLELRSQRNGATLMPHFYPLGGLLIPFQPRSRVNTQKCGARRRAGIPLTRMYATIVGVKRPETA